MCHLASVITRVDCDAYLELLLGVYLATHFDTVTVHRQYQVFLLKQTV